MRCGFVSLLLVGCASTPAPAKSPQQDPPRAEVAQEGTRSPSVAAVEGTESPKVPDDVRAVPPNATIAGSGVAYRFLTTGDGSGASPADSDRVVLRYEGWTTRGEQIESVAESKGIAFTSVVVGWQEPLSLMKVGQRVRIWVPLDLAGVVRQETDGMVVYDVELVKIIPGPKPPPDVAGPPRGAKRTKKGVRYVVLVSGTGSDKPRVKDTVEVHYSGWTTDGKLFDSSHTRGRSASFGVGSVIPGWTDILQKMVVGDKWRVWIPEKMAYKGRRGRPAGVLVFEIELVSITVNKTASAPKNLKPPKSAKKTALGVHYRFVQRGPRKGQTPGASDKVEIHYSIWQTDGTLIDSSVTRGRRATFQLSRVVEGFRDGVMLMKVGDTLRFWIPESLAYKGRKPKGMLVVEVELFSISPP